jgi:hypothetical protein
VAAGPFYGYNRPGAKASEDSTVATEVARVLGGVAPHLMVTDPPYGVNYDSAWRNQAGRSINGTTRRIAAGTVIKPIGARWPDRRKTSPPHLD